MPLVVPANCTCEMNENNTIFKGDRFLWGVYFVLCIISIIEVYSSSSFLTAGGAISWVRPCGRYRLCWQERLWWLSCTTSTTSGVSC